MTNNNNKNKLFAQNLIHCRSALRSEYEKKGVNRGCLSVNGYEDTETTWDTFSS